MKIAIDNTNELNSPIVSLNIPTDLRSSPGLNMAEMGMEFDFDNVTPAEIDAMLNDFDPEYEASNKIEKAPPALQGSSDALTPALPVGALPVGAAPGAPAVGTAVGPALRPSQQTTEDPRQNNSASTESAQHDPRRELEAVCLLNTPRTLPLPRKRNIAPELDDCAIAEGLLCGIPHRCVPSQHPNYQKYLFK